MFMPSWQKTVCNLDKKMKYNRHTTCVNNNNAISNPATNLESVIELSY